MGKKGFTLVELIVVVTILAILATIGFVSYSSYLLSVRDANRASQLVSMHDGLKLYETKNALPIPDDPVELFHGVKTVGYQGYIGVNTLETVDYNKAGKDPKTNEYFSYILTNDRKNFQLMAFFEEETPTPLKTPLLSGNDWQAGVIGSNLGILVTPDNIPIHEISSIKTSGLDLSDVGTESYIGYLKNGYAFSGSGTYFSGLITLLENSGASYSCKDILEKGVNNGDGIYPLVSGGKLFDAYCDMTNDGGGWTLINGVSDRFGTIVTINDTVPNIGNYETSTDTLGSLLPFIKNPVFKYSLSANGESFALYGQIDRFESKIEQNTYGETSVRTTSWIIMNDSIEVQSKQTSNYARFNLKGNGGSFPYGGHMKFYDSARGPHSWWNYDDGQIGGFYINGSILSVPIGSLPTMGGLFTWYQYSPERFELHASGTNDMSYSTDPALAGQVTAGLWVK